MEYEDKNAKPYFIAIIVFLIITVIGILFFLLMPETVEKILYKEGNPPVKSIKDIRENGQKTMVQPNDSIPQIKGFQ